MAKLLMLTGIVRSVYDRWRLSQILFSLVIIAATTIVVAVIVGATVAVSLQILYAELIASGISHTFALLTMGGSVAIIIFLLLCIVVWQTQRIRGLIKVNKSTSSACEIIDAFLDGFADR